MTQPFHVAISMDGNGRWATRRGLPRGLGHKAGVQTVRRIVEAAPDLGVTTLTLFAFSANNWNRPQVEVDGLMMLLDAYLRSDARRFVESGARLTLIGRRDRLPPSLVQAIEAVEAASAGGRRLHLRIAIDYSAREEIVRAANDWRALPAAVATGPALDAFSRLVAGAADAEAVDLMIRTGGEKRLSDFLLWECAYAELWFTDTLWPDFTEAGFAAAVEDFRRRERRFGGLSAGEQRAAG
ncbi:di-trans,poly-cis-decaprenylcistransferase [Caulobacter sp. KR2-114]|uniref:di-trans,poly-cis-decaprenylcistransferase n=1 Tax=Caulobacter sp. KR2-114 TaxID=3400912 RepID=UPI003C109A8C